MHRAECSGRIAGSCAWLELRMAPQRTSASAGKAKKLTTPVPPADAERKLRPVIEALFDSDNAKQALKIATQVEAKKKGWPAARALRALALRRLGRTEEAAALVDEILRDLRSGNAPADEDAALKLHLYYREIPHHECMSAEAFEIVASKAPHDIGMSETSFVFHIRAREYATAQKIAMRLQKMPPSTATIADNPRSRQDYAVWSSMAVWLANQRGTDQNPKLMALAGAMLYRAVTMVPVPSAEVVRYSVRFFCSTGRYADALTLLGNENVALGTSEINHLKAHALLASGGKAEALSLYESILACDSDDWSQWLKYLSLCDDDRTARDFVNKLCNQVTVEKKSERGQFLARIELDYRAQDEHALRASIVSYFERFGSKSVCAQDLRPYAHAYAYNFGTQRVEDKAVALCSMFHEAAPVESGSLRSLPASPQFDLSEQWLRLWLGVKQEPYHDFLQRYRSHVVRELESTDRQPGDDYIILAAHQLLPAVSTKRYADFCSVVKAITLLEAGLVRSPSNFHFKLLLIQLYSVAGIPDRIHELWASLEVKHVQVATLGHIVLHEFLWFGVEAGFRDLSKSATKLWGEINGEIPDSVHRALSEGSVNAAIEFIEFQDRLSRSRLLVEMAYANALSALSSAADEALSLERARMAVIDDCEVSIPSEFDKWDLVQNEDHECFEFWETRDFDSHRCRRDADGLDQDKGNQVAPRDKSRLLARLLGVRILLQISSQGGTRAEPKTRSKTPARRSAQVSETSSTPSSVDSDVALLRSLLASASSDLSGCEVFICRLVDLVCVAAGVGSIGAGMSAHDEGPAAGIAALSIDEPESGLTYIQDQIRALEVHPTGSTDSETAFASPQSLRAIGRLVFETLTLTAVGLTALSRAAAGGAPDRIRRAGEEYRTAALCAADKLSSLLRPYAQQCEGSAGTAFDTILDVESIAEAERIASSILSGSGDESTVEVDQEDQEWVARHVVGRIDSGQAQVATTIRSTLERLARRIKLVAV